MDKGLTSKDKGAAPVQRKPYRPEFLHMSKADKQKFEADEREKMAKVKAFKKTLDKPEAPKEAPAESKVKKMAKKSKAKK